MSRRSRAFAQQRGFWFWVYQLEPWLWGAVIGFALCYLLAQAGPR